MDLYIIFIRFKLKFEGEYVNGKRNGKGKEYDEEGKLLFEGEYLNGKELIGTRYDCYNNKFSIDNTCGKGNEYDNYGGIIFEGEYLNGKRNGKGKEYGGDYYELIYEGEYLNDKRYGKGKEYYYNGKLKFEGEFRYNKKWNGKGYDKNGNVMYELINGTGLIKLIEKYYNFDCSKFEEFEGEYINGERNGKGKEYWNDELIYEGEYLNGQRNGKGKEYWINFYELKFEGEYLYNYKIKGKYYIHGKLEFEGEFRYNYKWNGKGYDETGNIIYELINGNGKVKEYQDNGELIFEGEYLNGKRWNGKRKKYDGYDNLIFEEKI